MSPIQATSFPKNPMPGSLCEAQIRSGVRRGRFGLYQRRVRVSVFGEPQFEAELVPAKLEPTRPHVFAYAAWQQLRDAGISAGMNPLDLAIHSAYRSVEFQTIVWNYRLAERREQRKVQKLAPLPEAALERLQMKWTAKPGTSPHHTGFALDLGLYRLGKRRSKTSPTYEWLARNARKFGFYPYLPEAWHWEYNPPGLVRRVVALRQVLARGEKPKFLLLLPKRLPIASPAR